MGISLYLCTLTIHKDLSTVKPAHAATSIKAVACIKRSHFSSPVIENYI